MEGMKTSRKNSLRVKGGGGFLVLMRGGEGGEWKMPLRASILIV